jgi:hypothetical protein
MLLSKTSEIVLLMWLVLGIIGLSAAPIKLRLHLLSGATAILLGALVSYWWLT